MESYLLAYINKIASRYQWQEEPIGSFAGLYTPTLNFLDCMDPVLLSSCDGVGTKLLLANKKEHYVVLGIDVVAMNVNDILARGGRPLFFMNYFAGRETNDERILYFLEGVGKACDAAGCKLIGGETAAMKDVYDDDKFDVCGFATGVCDRDCLLPNKSLIQTGDVIIGVESCGFHSNGFTMLREIIDKYDRTFDDMFLDRKLENASIRNWLMRETVIYVNALSNLIGMPNVVKAMAHITGGGLKRNLRRVIPDNLDYFLRDDYEDVMMPDLMKEIQRISGMNFQWMTEHFNCGTGMAIIVQKSDVRKVVNEIRIQSSFKVEIIGGIGHRTEE